MNPFLNNNNIFSIMPNSIFNNGNEEEENKKEDDENVNVEEEIKIEKDENKLKQLKEVKQVEDEKKNKFYEVNVENVKYLEYNLDNANVKKYTYVSIGGGMLSFEEETNEKGEKSGIIVVRDSVTKFVKLQGIIGNKSTVEKVKLNSGLEIIMFNFILASYFQYNKNSNKPVHKMTILKIKVEKNNLEIFLDKAKSFFELMKK